MSDHAKPQPAADSFFKTYAKLVERFLSRTAYLVLYLVVLLVFIEGILLWTVWGFDLDLQNLQYVGMLGIVIWCVFGASRIGKFIAAVPKVTGLLTVNSYTGKLEPYPTGLHVIYPWEIVKKSNYIDMRVRGQEILETYPSKSGALMHTKWSFQYQPILELLELYISVSDEGIKKGMKDMGSSALSVRISQLEPDDVKAQQGEMEEMLRQKISEHDPEPDDLYGIRLTKVALADIDYDPSVQQVRSSLDIAKRLNLIAAAVKADNKDISDKDAMNVALIVNKNITKHVFEVEGAGPALEALLKQFGGKK